MGIRGREDAKHHLKTGTRLYWLAGSRPDWLPRAQARAEKDYGLQIRCIGPVEKPETGSYIRAYNRRGLQHLDDQYGRDVVVECLEWARAQTDPVDFGELVLYQSMTAIGTVACRKFRDEEGRVWKTIHYSYRPELPPRRAKGRKQPIPSPCPEYRLVEQSVTVLKFDERGLNVREELYFPGMKHLRRFAVKEYDDQKALTRRAWHEEDGIRRYETRYADGVSTSDLYFDDTGRRLIAMRGPIPADVELGWTWGEAKDELTCGLAMTQEKGALEDLGFYINVKNLGPHRSIWMEPAARVIILTPTGQTVQSKARRAVPGKPVPRGSSGTGDQGAVCYYYPANRLADYCEDLDPGEYLIRAEQFMPKQKVTLVSEPVRFEVLPSDR